MSGGLRTQVGQLARRSVLRTLRQPGQIVPALIFPLFLLAVNSGGLKDATNLPGFPTDSYLTFALAVPFMQGALFSVMNAGTDLARDIETGFLNRLALTPLRGAALLSGLLAGAIVLGLVQAVTYLAVGLIAGADLAAGAGGALVIVALAVSTTVAFGTLGLFAALRDRQRRGGAEPLPGLLRLPLHLLDGAAARPDPDPVVPRHRQRQPGLLPAAGLPLALDRRLEPGRAGARLRDRRGDRRDRHVGGGGRAEDAAGAHVTRQVAAAVAWRSVRIFIGNPQFIVPAIVFPLFFFIAFAGGLSAIADAPGFDFPAGYTAFQFVFVLLQSAAFGGVFTGFGIARDFESGFARRYLLAARDRRGIVLGYALAALLRSLLTWTVLTVVALVAGMQVGGDGVELFGLYGLAVLVNLTATMWAAGVAMRVRSIQGGPLMQFPVFLILFLAPVYVPLSLLSGWIHAVASVNPVTALLEAGRGFISGEPVVVALAFAIAVALPLLFALWARGGLQARRSGGLKCKRPAEAGRLRILGKSV